MRIFLVLVLPLILPTSFASTVSLNPVRCQFLFTHSFSPPIPKETIAYQRQLHEIKTLKMATFNLNDFHMIPEDISALTHSTSYSDQFINQLARYSKKIKRRLMQALKRKVPFKSKEHVLQIAKTIQDIDADIVFLQEIENAESLEALNKTFLDHNYKPVFLTQSNERVDVGFLIKKDIQVNLRLESNNHITWNDSVDGTNQKLFLSDLPALIITPEGKTDPSLIVLSHHGKSKRTRRGDRESDAWRRAQIIAIAKLVASYEKRFPQTPIIIGGDFNTGKLDSALNPLKKILTESFDASEIYMPEHDQYTQIYFSSDGSYQAEQLDMFWGNKSFKYSVLSAWVYRYKDKEGNIVPRPLSFKQRQRNPSDHYPLVIELNTQTLLND